MAALSLVGILMFNEKATVSKALDARDAEVASLEAQVGRGAFNKSTTKVLHLVTNPARTAMISKAEQEKAELKELRAEVKRLRAEQGGPGSGSGAGTGTAVAPESSPQSGASA